MPNVVIIYHHHNIANIHVPGTILNTLPVLPHVILTTLGSGYTYYPSFTGEETEVKISKVTCPKAAPIITIFVAFAGCLCELGIFNLVAKGQMVHVHFFWGKEPWISSCFPKQHYLSPDVKNHYLSLYDLKSAG